MASTRRRTGISFFHADNLSFLIAQLRQRWAMYCRYCRVLPLDQFTALTFILSIKGLLHLQSSSGNTERGIVHGGASEQPRPGVLSLRPCYFTPLSSLCRTFPPAFPHLPARNETEQKSRRDCLSPADQIPPARGGPAVWQQVVFLQQNELFSL